VQVADAPLSTTELDTHADTCCFGRNSMVLSIDEAHSVTVSGFTESMVEMEVPIATVAVAYDDAATHTTFILIFHQVLYVENMEHNLVSPFQVRINDIVVNDTPLRLLVTTKRLEDISDDEHSILVPTPTLKIPLKLKGTISYFNTRRPTKREVDDVSQFPRIVMTYASPEWNPHDETLDVDEEKLRQQLETIREIPHLRDRSISAITSSNRSDMAIQMKSHIYISQVDLVKTRRRKGTVQVEELAKRWHISLELAKRTIESTTQKGVRDFSHMLGSRRLRHLTQQLAYRPLKTICYTDTMFSKIPTLHNRYTCAQIYCTDFNWTKVYPMKTKADAHYTLDLLHHYFGAFQVMIPDNAKELTEGEFRAKIRKAGSVLAPVEAYSPNQNRAESAIRELKRMYRRAMISSKAPEILWDHCFQLMAEIRSHTALNMMRLGGETPLTHLIGETADISHLCQFEWYEYVWWLDVTDKLQNKKLGHYLGPSLDVGDMMCSKILTSKATTRVYSSVFPLTIEDRNSEVVKAKIVEYEAELLCKLRERAAGIEPVDEPYVDPTVDDYETPDDGVYHDENGVKEHEMPEADDYDHGFFDKYIGARIMIPDPGGVLRRAKVTKRTRDEDGELIGRSHANPILDTSLYELEFDDGMLATYTANIIAENLYDQIDDEGRSHVIFDSITDHKKGDDAVSFEDGFVEVNGRKHPKKSSKGWKLCVLWKDGTTSWIALKDLKESHPIQVAEYAVARELTHEPAFSWWVPQVLRRRNRIISAAQTKYARTDQKYGVEIPHSLERALEIDKETGTTFWEDAYKKEMNTVFPAFEILEDGSIAPVGFQKIPCHLIFDIKLDMTRKVRFVAGGHKTEPPASITYASVVSRESVRITFLLAALNGLDVLSADVQGAYLNAPCREKVYTICGPEFGIHRGKIAVIRLALYGLKSSGYAWRSHLAETLRAYDFTMCYADNDVWMKPAVRADGTKYYEYVLIYTDDILAVSMNPRQILSYLDQHYLLKPESIGRPTRYLGAKIGRFKIEGDENEKWTMSPEEYVVNQVKELEIWIDDHNYSKLRSKASSVLPSNYRPELDASEYLNPVLHQFYQQKVGVLRWAVELGQINITTEVSMMAAYTTAPRMGHLEAVIHIFAFLKHHPRSRLVFDDSYIEFEPTVPEDFTEFYPDAQEAIPPNAPEPLGKGVQMTAFSDSDHAGDLITRRSRTGVLIFLNRAPIQWYSKKQSGIETSTFGAEFMALKTATDLVKGLRYKMRMMGVPIEGPTRMRVDNMSVVNNTTRPESVLKKKSNSIAYHYVRESVAAGEIVINYEPTETNLADMLTKTQTGPVRKRLADMVLF
jgi:hypothetical protein